MNSITGINDLKLKLLEKRAAAEEAAAALLQKKFQFNAELVRAATIGFMANLDATMLTALLNADERLDDVIFSDSFIVVRMNLHQTFIDSPNELLFQLSLMNDPKLVEKVKSVAKLTQASGEYLHEKITYDSDGHVDNVELTAIVTVKTKQNYLAAPALALNTAYRSPRFDNHTGITWLNSVYMSSTREGWDRSIVDDLDVLDRQPFTGLKRETISRRLP